MQQVYRAGCVCTPFSSVETTAWISNRVYIIIIIFIIISNSSSTAIKRTL